MNHKLLLAFIALCQVTLLVPRTPLRAADKPNVLFLFADDMRADTIAAHGNPHVRTPNLDRLAASGFSFRGNYVFGGNSGAVCVPSRAMLMSGKTWFHVDTATLKDVKLLPELLGENGYDTFATGKWHNGQPSWLRAFQRGRSVMFGGMSDHTKVPVRDLGPDRKLSAERTGEKFSSELFADSVIEFLGTRDGAREKPFFAYVAFTAPHDPRQPPLSYREPYYRSLPPLPPNFLPQLPFDNGMMQGGRDENLGAWPRTEAMIRDQLAEYYGLITNMDEQIGRILAALQQTGQADNTIIVFAADNGLALGSHGLLGKQSVFEHSMRTPLIVAGPGIPRGKSTTAFTYLLDLFPTLCDVLAVQPPTNLAGESLRPLWEGKRERVRDSVFLPFLQLQRAVRDDRWKLIAYPKIGHWQLFDLQTDPHETTDLIDRPEHAPHVARLQNLLREWQTKVGDTLEVPVAGKAPERIDLTGRPRTPDPWQPDWIVKKYFAPPAAVPSRPVKVFVLAGQSNMEGQGFIAAEPRRNEGRGSLEFLVKNAATTKRFAHLVDGNGQWRTRDDVWISYLDRQGPLTVGYGARKEMIGPELGFGWVMGDALDEPVLLVKCAWGGKSLAVDFRPPSAGKPPYSLGEKQDAAIAADPTLVGKYYRETLTRTKAALAGLKDLVPGSDGRFELAGFGWHQGWNDRINDTFNAEYESNLSHFIRDVRKDLGAPHLPFVIAETGMTGPDEKHPRALSLMRAQAAVAERAEFKGNVAFVGTKEFWRPPAESPSGQGYHWNSNAETYYLIGEAMGEAMSGFLGRSRKSR